MSNVNYGPGSEVMTWNYSYPAEMYYLRHTRTCSCCAAGATHGRCASRLQPLCGIGDGIVSMDVVSAWRIVTLFFSALVIRGILKQGCSTLHECLIFSIWNSHDQLADSDQLSRFFFLDLRGVKNICRFQTTSLLHI